MLLTLCLAVGSQAQTFTYTTAYDTLDFYGDTLYFNIPTSALGAWGTATVVVDTDADMGDQTETMTLLGEDLSVIGNTGSNPMGNDCEAFSVTFNFAASPINAWAADGTIRMYIVASPDVDMFCPNNHARITLTYNHCAFGNPVEYAALTLSDTSICPTEQVMLSGTPAGGTFSGQGISGNTFSPEGLPPGMYAITYTATDAIGCTTDATKWVQIRFYPQVANIHICPNTAATLTANSALTIWSWDESISNPLDTAAVYTTGVLDAPTVLYAALPIGEFFFRVDTLTGNNFAVVDHNGLTGDDRSGIAVTPNYVYIVGDNATARYDLNLGNGVGGLPVRDGIFSNLADGKLYTLYDGSAPPANNPYPYNVTSFRNMDENLALTNEMVVLSSPVQLINSNYVGIFAGNNLVILFDGTSTWYAVNIATGMVTNLGQVPFNNSYFYGSENWAIWGLAEYDGSNYSVVYRDGNTGDIVRHSLVTGNAVSIAPFGWDISDMACLTYSPWNNRWYFHHEGGSAAFGGSSETLGYAHATVTRYALSNDLSCPAAVQIGMDVIDLGPDRTVCSTEGYLIFAPTGYLTYTWNGVPLNINVVPTDIFGAGTYTLEAMAPDGCLIADEVEISFFPEPLMSLELTPDLFCLFQNPVALSGGMPAGGVYTGNGISGTNSFDPQAAGLGGHIVTYTYTDGNGCSYETYDALYVNNCVGVEEIQALEQVSLFPNPNQGEFTLSVELAQAGTLSISLVDAVGRSLYHTVQNQAAGTWTGQIQVPGLASGLYLLRIETESGMYVEKVQVIRE